MKLRNNRKRAGQPIKKVDSAFNRPFHRVGKYFYNVWNRYSRRKTNRLSNLPNK